MTSGDQTSGACPFTKPDALRSHPDFVGKNHTRSMACPNHGNKMTGERSGAQRGVHEKSKISPRYGSRHISAYTNRSKLRSQRGRVRPRCCFSRRTLIPNSASPARAAYDATSSTLHSRLTLSSSRLRRPPARAHDKRPPRLYRHALGEGPAVFRRLVKKAGEQQTRARVHKHRLR